MSKFAVCIVAPFALEKVSISAYIVADDNMCRGDNICRQRHSTLKNHHCLTAIGVEHKIHFKTVFHLLTYHITIEISIYMKLFLRGLDAEFIYNIYKRKCLNYSGI